MMKMELLHVCNSCFPKYNKNGVCVDNCDSSMWGIITVKILEYVIVIEEVV